jgi:SAM-dependent methyltransferase
MANKFKYRSNAVELIDAPDIPKELFYQNLRELDFINRILAGHSISLKGIKKLVFDKNRTYHIVDFGCGSGDTLKYIADWSRKKGYKVNLIGIDKNADAIDFLKEHCREYPEIKGIVGDYRDYLKTGNLIDIMHCSLFCHHLNDNELIDLFGIVKANNGVGFVINDLHRHWLAFWGFYLLTRLLKGSTLSKNDGPISVLRAFKRKELKSLFIKAEVVSYSIRWKWAFRYLAIGYN